MKGSRLYWLICSAALLAACNSPTSEWSKATAADTIPAYQAFVSRYPDDAHVSNARTRIASLQDAQAWSTAQISLTIDGYQQYLASEPNGQHAQNARDEISTLERSNAWYTAQSNATAESLRAFLQKYPIGPEADEARDKLKTLTAYRAELGTARSQHAAEREREALVKRFSNDLHQMIVLTPDTNSAEYRVTSVPMSEQAADATCATVKHEGHSCTVIQVAG